MPRVVTAFNDPEVKEAMAKQGNVINLGAGRQGACRSSAASARSTRSW